MTTHNKTASPTAGECQARTIADYFKRAKAVLSRDTAFGYDPQIVAALIVAQAIDRHGEVLACELSRCSQALSADLKSLEDRLAVALGHRR